jgi:DNA-binding transcriptional LysR family regulator
MNPAIELRHLHYFLHVAEELHFGRAAERLGMAQAPLSQQIRQLEERLGARLFDRTTRSVVLTPAGSVFLDHARDVLASMNQAVAHTRLISGGERQSIAVGAVSVALYHLLPSIIARFRAKYPEVQVEVVPLPTAEQLKMLTAGELNIAFIRPPASLGFMERETIFKEGFVAIMRHDHPLAARQDLRLRDLKDQDFVGYRSILGASYHNTVIDHCRKAGFIPRFVQEASHTVSVSVLVAAGVGVAIIPEWTSLLPVDGLVHRRLPEMPETIDLVIAWPAGEPSPVIRHFIEVTRRLAPTFPASAPRGHGSTRAPSSA